MKTLAVALRRKMIAGTEAAHADLRGKHFLVTGATPGSLGFATAVGLANRGASVIITCRTDVERAVAELRQQIPGRQTSISGHVLDLSSAQSVADFIDWFMVHHGTTLHALINNAGIHLDLMSQWQQPRMSEDGFEIQWRTNYLGTYHLTMGLLPILRETGLSTGDSRVVNVVSHLHNRGHNEGLFAPLQPYNSWVAYGVSKLALVHFTRELQRRYAESDNLQAYCLHPGAVFTHVAGKGLAGNPTLQSIRNRLAFIEKQFLKTPEEGAQTSIHCATTRGLIGGGYYRDCRPVQASRDSEDELVAARLWQDSQTWLGSL